MSAPTGPTGPIKTLPELSAEQRLTVMQTISLAVRTPPTQDLHNRVDNALTWLEHHYDLSSDVILMLVNRGQLNETPDVCHWLVLLYLYEEMQGCLNPVH